MERFLSIRQASELTGFTYGYLWGLVKTGRLASIRVEKSIRIPESSLESFIVGKNIKKSKNLKEE